MIVVILLCFIIFYLISILSETVDPRLTLLQPEPLQSEPVSCTGHFGTWSPCNGSTAERERVYTITREEANGGDRCEHNHGDTQRSGDCRVDCLGEFGTWTPCDGTTRRRVRTYTTTREQANGGDKCDHNHGDTQESDNCPIPCLGEFGSWSACDGTTVRREKTYIVTQQAANGGDTCDYEDQHTEAETNCPVNCAGDYGTWGPCDRTTGTKQRIYRVTRHALNQGVPCAKPDGHTEETTTDCPVDCAGEFGTWSPCDKIATKSVRVYRVTRQEANGGDGCDPYMDGEVQESTGCPVDCVGDFGTWSPCDRSSTRTERAYRVTRHAVNGGDTCYPHADGDTQTLTNCPVDCVGDFGTWSPCDGSSTSRERAYRVTRHAVNGGETCYPHADGDRQTLTDCLVACNIEGCNSEMLAYINTSDAITALWDNQLIDGCRNCPRRHVVDGKWHIEEDGVVRQISVTDNDLLYALIKIPPNTAETCNINTCNTGMAAQSVTDIIDTSNIGGCEGCPRRIFKNGFLFRDGLPIATAVGDDYWYSGSALHEGQRRVTNDHLIYWEATAPYYTCENPSAAAFVPCTYLDFVGNRIFSHGHYMDHRRNPNTDTGTMYRLGFANKNKNNTNPYSVDPLTALGPLTLEIKLDPEKMQQCEQQLYIRFKLSIPPRSSLRSSKCNHYEPWSDTTGNCKLVNDKIVVKMFPGEAAGSIPSEHTKFGYTFQIFQNKFSASKLSSRLQLDGDASRAKFEDNFMNNTPHNFEMMYRDFGEHGKTLLTAIDGQIYEQVTSSNSFPSDIPSDTTTPMRLIIRMPQHLMELHEVEVKTGDFEWPVDSIVFS